MMSTSCPATTVVAAVPMMSFRKNGEAHMCFEVAARSGAFISARWTIHRTLCDFMRLHVEATRQGLQLPPLPALRGFRKQNAFQELERFSNRVLELPAATSFHACAAFFQLLPSISRNSDRWMSQYSHLAMAATTVQKHARQLLARQTVARFRRVRTAAKALQAAARERRRRWICHAAAEGPVTVVESAPDVVMQPLAPAEVPRPREEGLLRKTASTIWWLDLVVGATAPVLQPEPEQPMLTWDAWVGAVMLQTRAPGPVGAPPVCVVGEPCAV